MGIRMKAIEVNGLTKTFVTGKEEANVLKELNFSVDKGEFVSIMGPSGSGKSTLLYLLGGLDKPTSGTIMLEGEDLSKVKKKAMSKLRRSKIGFVFQFQSLFLFFFCFYLCFCFCSISVFIFAFSIAFAFFIPGFSINALSK